MECMRMTDIDMLSELPEKDQNLWACCFGNCPKTATHRWDLIDGDYTHVCPFHTDRDFMVSIMSGSDHIPTFQDLVLKGFNPAKANGNGN